MISSLYRYFSFFHSSFLLSCIATFLSSLTDSSTSFFRSTFVTFFLSYMLRRGCCTAARSFCHRVATPLFFPFYLHFCACVCVCLRLLAFRTRHFCILPTFCTPYRFFPHPVPKARGSSFSSTAFRMFFFFSFPTLPHIHTHTHRDTNSHTHMHKHKLTPVFSSNFFFLVPVFPKRQCCCRCSVSR